MKAREKDDAPRTGEAVLTDEVKAGSLHGGCSNPLYSSDGAERGAWTELAPQLRQANVAVCEPPAGGFWHHYQLYGLHVRSRQRLSLAEGSWENGPCGEFVDVEIEPAPGSRFARVTSGITLDPYEWIHHHELLDSWSFLRYDGLFEFLVAPRGDRILFHHLGEAPTESFQTYLLGRVFSYALVKMGYEPLHAATVVVDGCAVAFLGASTFGKSTLAGTLGQAIRCLRMTYCAWRTAGWRFLPFLARPA
jgi:hypothetical protein